MKNIILHIPHASDHIALPLGYQASDEDLKNEILKLTDWHTDDLFQHDQAIQVVAPFSRIFCDVERFPDDEMEVMAKYGMGMLYEKFDDGRQLRTINEKLRDKIYTEYYKEHHDLLLGQVEKQLAYYNTCIIIDCHSFPDTPFNRDLDKAQPRPDYNIGTDWYHTSVELLATAEQYFRTIGYTLAVNAPYSGSIVPLQHYKKDKRVQTIMLEVNRRLYLKENTNSKSSEYLQTKKVVHGFIDTILKNHLDVL